MSEKQRAEDIAFALDEYDREVDYLVTLPDYTDEEKAVMRARQARIQAYTTTAHSISPDTDGSWACDCGAEGFDIFDLASHFNEAAHPAMRDDPVAILDAHIPSVTQDMDDGELEPWIGLEPRDELGDYIGDMRVCHCGLVIDGYYDYVEHLKEMLA